MDKIIISTHIPKTGGTSFRNILSQLYGDRLIIDHPWLEKHSASGAQFNMKDIGSRIQCIHGHFLLKKYKFLDDFKNLKVVRITWTRDPVERAISAYNFLREKAPPCDLSTMKPWEIGAKIYSLEKYYSVEDCKKYSSDAQCKQLKGYEPEDLDFIGITEYYDESIELFLKLIYGDSSIRLDTAPKRVKKKSFNKKYKVGRRIKSLIKDINQKDMDFYEESLDIFVRMCKENNIKLKKRISLF